MLTKLQDEHFDKVFEIIEESFPTDEYRTYDEQKTLLKNKYYSIYVIKDIDSEDIKAFIAIWNFTDFIFIEHFAVSKKFRNSGLGSDILTETFKLFSGKLCLEVEPPDTQIAIRRIEFYKRNGFFLNEYPYIQPSISKGRKALRLMIMTSEGKISENTFEEYKKTLYKHVYNIR